MKPKNITKLHNTVLKKHLEEYSKWTFSKTQKAVARVQVGGQFYSMDFRTVCQDALHLIEQSELHALKFEVLVKAMKEMGYSGLYQHIVGESIEYALTR